MENETKEYIIENKKINKSLTLTKNIMGVPLYVIWATFIIYGVAFLLTFSPLVIIPFIVQLAIFQILCIKDPYVLKFIFRSMFRSSKLVP